MPATRVKEEAARMRPRLPSGVSASYTRRERRRGSASHAEEWGMSYDVLKAVAGRRDSALVSIVRVSGSTPRGTGSKMAVFPDGSIVGTVGGGILESRAIERARACIAEGTSDRLAVE